TRSSSSRAPRSASCSAGRARAQALERPHQDLPLGIEGELLHRDVGVEPGRVVDLAVVVAGLAALVAQEEELHGLAHAPAPAARADVEPEHDVAQVLLDQPVAAGLLADLAARGVGEGLAIAEVAFRQLPARRAARGDEADLDAGIVAAPEHA